MDDGCGRAALVALVNYGWDTAYYLITKGFWGCSGIYNTSECEPNPNGNVCWHFTCSWRDCAQFQVDECTNTSTIPPSWSCDPSFYGSNDGCHCNCGAWDKDCNDLTTPTLGCHGDDICIHPGVCQDRSATLDARKKIILHTEGIDVYDANYVPTFGPYKKISAPKKWRCPSEYYGSYDGCDEDCGVEDPDCFAKH